MAELGSPLSKQVRQSRREFYVVTWPARNNNQISLKLYSTIFKKKRNIALDNESRTFTAHGQ